MKYLIGFCIASVLILVGCKSFEDNEKDVSKRLAVLEQKGLPDSLISSARLALSQAQGDKRRNKPTDADKKMKEAISLVKNAEVALQNSLASKPDVVARLNALSEKSNKDFRGLHKKEADSLLAAADSLLKIDYVFKAQNIVSNFENDYAKKLKDQATADSLTLRIVGTWTFLDTAKHSEDKNVNAVDRKVFTFKKDGGAYFLGEKKGQTSPYSKIDAKFETFGTWDIKGDVIYITATKFVQHRQSSWQMNEFTNKWGHISPQTGQFVEGKANVVEGETLDTGHKDLDKQSRNVSFKELEEWYKFRK
ncbi:MAG: hypothetical protein FWF51_00705 [Chitinivibrionia bacterium]|nr:hypothetical protein [Chitinivibrionia bacterium]